jgi:eukaryotic-like serine/threonine-protein kinase
MSETVGLTQGLPSHIRPGLIIGGKYRLEEEIGKGSMGTVYRAVHVTLGQRVAIKLISGEHLQSLEARKRFGVEAKAAAKLRSRHVVQVYDDGETPEGNPYIVLEYLEGETLEQRLEREHDLPLADAVRIVGHVGRALARAHAQGIVHRDLKPANIFLVKSDDDDVGWIAKVLDFGIAKLENQGEKGTTQAGTVLGTPLFMSPEQVRGASSVDHRADLYSLGMCLFHMLTSEFAFYSDNYSDILVGICTQPLPLLRTSAPWVPETVEQWFQRACAKEPLDRFQSADEMTEALQAAAGGMALTKHKSFPEGRIAPETLVGYASPALATLQLDAGPLSLARTQALPEHAAPAAVAVPIAIAVATNGADQTSGEWRLPERKLNPLLLGLGLGLVTVAVVAIAFSLLGGSDDNGQQPGSSARASTARVSVNPPAPPVGTGKPAPSAAPQVEATGVVSSVAAESAPTPAPVKPRGRGGTAKKVAPAAAAGPRPAPPRGTVPAKPQGSDLGF